MKFKNLVAAILAGLLLYGQMGNVEAKVYDVTADETRKINAVIGENADFLSLQTRIAASSAMADKCAEEHVKPYFAAKGIALSDAQAQAVAFGALELGDVNAGKTGNNIYFNAAGHVYYDESMDYVYGNKKFINAYIATQGELAEIFRNMGPAFAGYAQYSNDDSWFRNAKCSRSR